MAAFRRGGPAPAPAPARTRDTPIEFKDMSRHQQYKLMGFFGVGAVFTAVGAALMGCASLYSFPTSVNVEVLGPAALREALRRDRTHDSLFSAGISFLTSGLLILLGFGLTELLANRHSGKGPSLKAG